VPGNSVTAGRIPIRPHLKPIRIQNSDEWAFFDVCERPPIPHPKSYLDGLPRPRSVKLQRTFVQQSRFFPALVTSAEKSRHFIGPASFILLWRALANCCARNSPIWSASSAASAARGRPLLFCVTTPIVHSSSDSNFVDCVHTVDVTTRPTVVLFKPTDSDRR